MRVIEVEMGWFDEKTRRLDAVAMGCGWLVYPRCRLLEGLLVSWEILRQVPQFFGIPSYDGTRHDGTATIDRESDGFITTKA